MSIATLLYDIQMVRVVRPAPGGLVVGLGDGRGVFLDEFHPQFDFWVISVESPMREYYPVGVLTDEADRALDLNSANDTSVQRIEDSPTTPDCVRVGFWSYSPVCGLSREHPEFGRIHATLAEALAARRRVYVATHTSERVADDFGDGEPCDLPKIMDVRFAPDAPLPPPGHAG